MYHLSKVHRSQLQESSVARRLKGKRQIASGSKPHWKLDVSSDKFLVECKFTDKKGFRVTKDLLEKVRRESAKQCKTGIIFLDIDGFTCYVVPPSVVEE